MAIRNLTLVEYFICQHFDKIFNFICFGSPENKWKIEAKKSQVMESIHLFFQLCLNAGKVKDDYKEIEEWITSLTKIACAQRSHGIVSSYQYRVLFSASDPITKFLFYCFDWNINDIIPGKPYYKDNTILASFHHRLKFYKEHISYQNKEYAKTATPLFDIKNQRNDSVHKAISFYANRHQCFEKLVEYLYNYIMAFHMVRTVGCENVRSLRGSFTIPVNIKEEVKTLIKFPSSTNIRIDIECVDKLSGKPITGREQDIRVYRINGSIREEVNHETTAPNRFKVSYFNEYEIYIMTKGEKSKPSEKLFIEYDFVDGTVVRINIPPKGHPKPEKISIRELILYSENDLPDDVKFLLGEMERYSEKDEYACMARSLVFASATNNERDRRNYLEAVGKIRKSLTAEIAKGIPHNIHDYLQSKIEEIHTKMSEPYQIDRFHDLCKSIDEIYDELDYKIPQFGVISA